MIRLGLTGSIGMGKSTTAAMFAARGVPVFDSDRTVHDLYGNEAVAAIEAAFPGTTGVAGVDREALSKAVLGDRQALGRLERQPPFDVGAPHVLVRRHQVEPLGQISLDDGEGVSGGSAFMHDKCACGTAACGLLELVGPAPVVSHR